MSQDELSDGGQAHDASSHHGHVIRAERHITGEVTDSSNMRWLLITDQLYMLQKVESRAEYLCQWFNVQLYMTV